MDNYEALIQRVSELIDLPLSLGNRRQVALQVDNVLTVHIEHIIPSDKVRVATLVYSLPPNAARTRVLTSALKANSPPIPIFGTFAFSSKKGALVLFEHMRLEDTQPEPFCDFLEAFILKAKKWLEALDSGRTEPADFNIQNQGSPGGIFGLH